MDIPIKANVELLDGDGGHTTRVLPNPITRRITHLIVREPGFLGMEREVPIELGILLLIATPVLRVATSAALFLLEGDRRFALIALVVLLLLLLSLFGLG